MSLLLELLLVLASAVTLRSESLGTHDHILLSPPTWRVRSPYLYPPGTGWPGYTLPPGSSLLLLIWIVLSLSLILRPTVSRPVCLGIKHPSGAYDQIFITLRQLRVCWYGTLSDERTGLPFKIAAGPRQRSHFRVLVPRDSWPYFTVSDSRLPFSSPPTTRRATVEVFEPASTWDELLFFTRPLI
jgi:hypothetical protein